VCYAVGAPETSSNEVCKIKFQFYMAFIHITAATARVII
jgi:hypothetical protein